MLFNQSRVEGTVKMATNKNSNNDMNNSCSSDFSIDHILNRAGDKYFNNAKHEKYSYCETFSTNSSGSNSGDESVGCDYEQNFYQNQRNFNENDRFINSCLPNFDWLNYTRYNMPRLPSEYFQV